MLQGLAAGWQQWELFDWFPSTVVSAERPDELLVLVISYFKGDNVEIDTGCLSLIMVGKKVLWNVYIQYSDCV